MAWSAPRTWSVSEVVTAAMMNAHVRDNLLYLKGNAGAVTIEDRVNIPLTSAGNGKGIRFGDATNQYGNIQSLDLASNSYVFFTTNRQYDGSAWQQLNARAGGALQVTQDTMSFSAFPVASSTPTTRMSIDTNGNMGVGATAPAGRLHVSGAGAVSGAGFAISSVAAVTSIQTIFAAGTIARGATIYYMDRNNTGGALLSSATAGTIALSGSISYVNADTITIAVTAGGAMTVQRTSGTNGTHDVVILAIFL